MSLEVVSPIDAKHLVLGAEEEAACIACLRSGDLSGTGDIVTAYERELAAEFGARHAVACSSGSTAIHLALVAARVGPGDEVILPPTAPAMTALPVLALGASPVFVDTQSPRSFALDVDSMERAVTSRTRAVISVPMWGYPADSRDLVAATQNHGLILVEDAAQAHGARGKDGTLGTLGDIGAFSTHARKLVATGEGGFCVTDDSHLAEQVTSYRNFGQATAAANGGLESKGGFANSHGHNFKLAAILAAIGRVQLARLRQRIAQRTQLAQDMASVVERHPALASHPGSPVDRPNFYGFLLHTVGPRARELGEHMAAGGFISDTLRYAYRPLYETGVFKPFAGACPAAEELTRTVVALPCHEGLNGTPAAELTAQLEAFS